MKKTHLPLIAISLLVSLAAEAAPRSNCEPILTETSRRETFAPEQIASAKLSDKNGWSLKWAKSDQSGEVSLVAVQEGSWLVRKINPLTGQTTGQFDLSQSVPGMNALRVESTHRGDLVMAAADMGKGRMAFHQEGGIRPANYEVGEAIRHLEIIPGAAQTVVAATAGKIHVLFYRLDPAALGQSVVLEMPGLVRKLHTVKTAHNEVYLIAHGLDHRVNVFRVTPAAFAVTKVDEFNLLSGRIFPLNLDGQPALAIADWVPNGGGVDVRVYSPTQRRDLFKTNVPNVIGVPVVESHPGHKTATLTLPIKERDGSHLLDMLPSPAFAAAAVSLQLGQAKEIRDLRPFRVGDTRFFAYIQDGQTAQLQSQNASAVIPASDTVRIKQLTEVIELKDGRKVLAVLGQNGHTSASVIQLSK